LSWSLTYSHTIRVGDPTPLCEPRFVPRRVESERSAVVG
jgi:hypothetical protein